MFVYKHTYKYVKRGIPFEVMYENPKTYHKEINLSFYIKLCNFLETFSKLSLYFNSRKAIEESIAKIMAK